MKHGIYTITCTATDTVYIGQSHNIHLRFSQHKSKLRKGTHANPHLQAAWNKYGEQVFVFQVHTLEPDPSISNQLEQEVFAAALASGMRLFNIRPATATNKGVKFSRSTRTKLSEKAKQQFATLEARAKQSMAIRKTDEPCSLLAPGGQLHTFFNPTAFAHDHDLEPANILKLLRGTIHSYKGWTNPNTQLPPKKSSKLTNEQRDEICRRYEAGESSRTLAVVFGVMPASIIGLLKRRNIKRRPKHEAIANRWK